MSRPGRRGRPARPHKLWPITVITLVLLWILLIFLLIHNGPRLPGRSSPAVPPPGAGPAGQPLAAGASSAAHRWDSAPPVSSRALIRSTVPVVGSASHSSSG